MTATAFLPPDRPVGGLYSNSSVFMPSISSEKRDLSEAIKSVPRIAEEYDYAAIDTKTVNVALSFIARLPENRVLPKVAPDADGSVLLMWEGPNRGIRLGVTINGEVLRSVVNPGRDSDHLVPMLFMGYIPPAILANVPRR